ncbi:M28 family peptidase [Parafilimonas terrae]|uniref:PA domain-containing protein n=1 Tax=Parafilimonas terrae TaxID=1465490 RepID=A0A1I5TGJ3_9BACT|nr:M28 family peptidase [Parafilimonas terrae]SFP82153.1 PA domain-containing protein [Parafilimonas terrae]
MKKLLPLLLIAASLNASAQNKTAEKFAAAITPEALKTKLSVIAGAEMEGRETATEGQRKAAAYIEDHFKKLKLLPGDSGKYQMPYPVYQDSITDAAFDVSGKKFAFATDFSIAGSGIPQGTFTIGNIAFAGKGIKDSTHNDYDSLDTKQQWVMITVSAEEEKSFRSFYRRIIAAAQSGAAGVLIVSDNFPKDNSVYKGRMYLKPSQVKTPLFFVSKQLAEALINTGINENTARKNYSTTAQLQISKHINNLQSTNVIGVLPGTDKKSQYVFITAHYDHLGKQDSVIYYGADDDGSGTTSVLQMAEAFAKARDKGHNPRRTIVFMTVSGEEKGLWGSEYYTDHPLFNLDSTSVDLNIDMVGRIDPDRNYGDSTNYVYPIGEDKLSSDLMRISDSINNTYTHLELDRKFNDPNDPNRFYYRSDHYNFADKGVPIIFYFNGVHADYHRPTDTIDKINFGLMAKRVKLVFYTAWDMANRDAMLKRDLPLNAEKR